MNDWIGLTIDTSNEAEEAVANFLMEAGAVGIQIEDDTTGDRVGAAVTGFFATSTNLVELQANLTAKIAQLPGFGLDPGTGKISVKNALQADWANKWKQYYQPLRVSRYLTVVPEWLDYTPAQTGEIVLRLDPDMAFGTGAHPTTALMLQLLEAEIRGGEHMIDVGTGSGILAIAARRLGVATVLATDVDDVAVHNAEANLALNPVDQITVIANDLLTGIDTHADIICANILAEVLLPLIPQLPKRLAENGIVLLSGIFHDKEAAIRQALAKAGLIVTEARHRGDWVALVAKEVRA